MLYQLHITTAEGKSCSLATKFASAEVAKKFENLQAAVSLHFAHYNLVRLHKTTRVTPAMVAGVVNRLWSLEELVERTSK